MYNKRKWIGDTMQYTNIVNGKFVRRVNRFIAEVMVEGFKEQVHIKNTGRLKELLLPEVQVLLEKSQNPNRKTKYSIIAARSEEHTSELQSRGHLVCRLLLEKK